MHRYLAGADDNRRMLEKVGCSSVEELFASLPAEVRCGPLDLPPGRSEEEVRREFWALAGKNLTTECSVCFLGAGVYRHVQPAVADALLQRGEFFTAYTPYQPEVAQGTLQAIFEFQTYVCQLTELDVANASMYDGATAVVEAALLARRALPGRSRVAVAGSLHPDYNAVLRTYAEAQGIALTEVGWDAAGRLDAASLASALGPDVCAVIVQSPNVFGVVEDLASVGATAKAAGALAVQAVAEATSLGVLAPGGRFGFDVVCGELQAFGIPAAFGGPHLGFFAARQNHLRQMPGRLVGETVDAEGKRAFVLTLSTREQHIRRAKATSNICTNHGLMALAATMVLSLLGKKGVREVALASHSVAEYLKAGVRGPGSGVRLAFPEGPTYNEFLVLHDDPEGLLARMQKELILGGVATTRLGTDLPRGILIAATERNTREECDRLLDALRRLA
ncbi:MAG: aminomethyl-transferring glycine dehydrogenase subunit GcvPA [Thermoanaerobaculaceae bacterium]|jgi:glycine dehydrogenase subunit 1|nr:aminomethyl-transferring glycine dehydrogenase subunit GcvPA [Thermoanaerobaculaceae bacterium]